MFLFGLLFTLSQVCSLSGFPELPGLEAEFSADTDSCVEASRLKHKDDPNAGLDHFLNCLLKHVNTLQEKEENQEIDEIKTTLDKIEQIPLFSNDGFDHNLVKRQTEEEEDEEIDTTEDKADTTNEGRGWKKNGEKKKNKEKKNQEKQKQEKIQA